MYCIYILFQSTLPREERQTLDLQGFADYYFNPRSHERSDGVNTGAIGGFNNFNPRSHERSDYKPLIYKALQTIISIHAPTRGATTREGRKAVRDGISIHAPTRGATAILHKKFVYFYTIPTINI